MRKVLSFICFMLSLLFIACVSTPSKEYLINKSDNGLRNAISANAVTPYSFVVPKVWKEELEVRNQKMHINTKIETIDKTVFPVITIKKKVFNTQNSLESLYSILGNEIEIREAERSYDELLYDMRLLQRGYFDEIDEETGIPIFLPYDNQEEEMKMIHAQLAQAPMEETYVPLTEKTWSVPADTHKIRTAEGQFYYISCYSNQLHLCRDRDAIVQPESWVLAGNAYPGEPAHALNDITISEEEAVSIGDDIMYKLDRSDMRIASIEKARSADSFYNELGEGYLLIYVSALPCSVPCYLQKYAPCIFLDFDSNKTDYTEPWYAESIKLFITEDGVLDLFWTNPKETVAIANENVQLLPFEQIQQNVRKLFEYGMNGRIENEDVHLYRIILGASIQQIPNQGDEAFLVPTWCFFFQTDSTRRHSDMKEYVLLISALDGTHVNHY